MPPAAPRAQALKRSRKARGVTTRTPSYSPTVKRGVASHHERGAAGDGCGQVLVVIRVLAHTSHLNGIQNDVRQEDQVLHPECGVEAPPHVPADLGICEGPHDLVDDRVRQDQRKRVCTEELFDDAARRSVRVDRRAHEHVGVKDGADHGRYADVARGLADLRAQRCASKANSDACLSVSALPCC